MTLLSRRSSRAVLVLTLLALIALPALPVSWSSRAPWSAVGPTLAWAGGSPDETLGSNPGSSASSQPPKKAKRATDLDSERFASPVAVQSWQYGSKSAKWTRSLWTVLWRVSLASTVRF